MPGPRHGGGPMGGPGSHHGPMGGPMGRPGGHHRPMGGPMGGPPPPPRHHYGWSGWSYRRPYRSGCLGGFLALVLGFGGLFVFAIFIISSIF